jgi:hypothetical protein
LISQLTTTEFLINDLQFLEGVLRAPGKSLQKKVALWQPMPVPQFTKAAYEKNLE